MGSLRVRIVAARDLPLRRNGTHACNTYCKVSVVRPDGTSKKRIGRTFKTKTYMNSLNPVWEESFKVDLELNVEQHLLYVAVLDKRSKFLPDTLLGSVLIPLNSVSGSEEVAWHQVSNVTQKGELQLGLKWKQLPPKRAKSASTSKRPSYPASVPSKSKSKVKSYHGSSAMDYTDDVSYTPSHHHHHSGHHHGHHHHCGDDSGGGSSHHSSHSYDFGGGSSHHSSHSYDYGGSSSSYDGGGSSSCGGDGGGGSYD